LRKISCLFISALLISCSSGNDPSDETEMETNLTPSEKLEGNWNGWGASFYLPNNYTAQDASALNQVGNSNRRNYSFNSDGTGTGYIQPRITDVAVTCEDASQVFNLFEWEIEEVSGDGESYFQSRHPGDQLYYLYIRPYIERGVRCRKTLDFGNCIENIGEWLPCEGNRPERLIIYFENDDEFRILNTIFDPERDLNVTYNFYRN